MGSFPYRSGEELLAEAERLGLDLPYRESVDTLLEPIPIGERELPNRLAIHPMEGFDADADGAPGELAFRRYRRFASGGSGLIWFEAASVAPEGRSNPRQLYLHEGTLDRFRRLVDETRSGAAAALGPSHRPLLVLQLTHSGRYSRPDGVPRPLVAVANPEIDHRFESVTVVDDDYLRSLQDRFVEAARMAQQAGFDAVDIKACHGYLVHELLGAFTREESIYGGEDLAARSRFLAELAERIGSECPGLLLTVRLNIYDGVARPYGFGVPGDGSSEPDLTEPLLLINRLIESDCVLLNATAGVPSHNPWTGRPFNRPVAGDREPPEHPLTSVLRLIRLTAAVQNEVPALPVVGTGYSWLRQFYPHVAAAVIAAGDVSIVGVGRSAFAYPEAPRDLMESGRLDPARVCVACSGCSELIRNGRPGGCIVRDREIYGKEYRELHARRREEPA